MRTSLSIGIGVSDTSNKKAANVPVFTNGDFSSTDISEWSRGYDSVNGTLAVVGGVLTHTQGVSDLDYPRWKKTIVGFEVGVNYTVTGTRGGTAADKRWSLSSSPDGTGGTSAITTNTITFTADATTMYFSLIIVLGTAGQTSTVDNVSIALA